MNVDTIYNKILEILTLNDKEIKNVLPNDLRTTIFVEGTGAFRIILNKNNQYIAVKQRYEHLFNNPLRLSTIKSDTNWLRYSITTEYDLDEIKNVILSVYDDCRPSGRMFGCCSRFNQCSDAKQCIHPDKVYAKNCWYQENLKQGKIFYGVNRNV